MIPVEKRPSSFFSGQVSAVSDRESCLPELPAAVPGKVREDADYEKYRDRPELRYKLRKRLEAQGRNAERMERKRLLDEALSAVRAGGMPHCILPEEFHKTALQDMLILARADTFVVAAVALVASLVTPAVRVVEVLPSPASISVLPVASLSSRRTSRLKSLDAKSLRPVQSFASLSSLRTSDADRVAANDKGPVHLLNEQRQAPAVSPFTPSRQADGGYDLQYIRRNWP
eukprot:Sspe_Gene.46759::Locus_23462_Transcript_1_1_Confidence_1.000_Length_1441::g.46759::m.46759